MRDDPARFVRAWIAEHGHSARLAESFRAVGHARIRNAGSASSSSFDDRLLASGSTGVWNISPISAMGIERGAMVAAR